MKFETIMDKIDNGVYDTIKCPTLYKDDYVFDEDKSVKWNREEVIKQNEKIKKKNSIMLK